MFANCSEILVDGGDISSLIDVVFAVFEEYFGGTFGEDVVSLFLVNIVND